MYIVQQKGFSDPVSDICIILNECDANDTYEINNLSTVYLRENTFFLRRNFFVKSRNINICFVFSIYLYRVSHLKMYFFNPLLESAKGAFNNYVEKMRGGGGQKCIFFCSRSGYKNCPRKKHKKMAKFCPRSC